MHRWISNSFTVGISWVKLVHFDSVSRFEQYYYEDPYENHFGDKAFLVKYCIYYYYYYCYYRASIHILFRGF